MMMERLWGKQGGGGIRQQETPMRGDKTARANTPSNTPFHIYYTNTVYIYSSGHFFQGPCVQGVHQKMSGSALKTLRV